MITFPSESIIVENLAAWEEFHDQLGATIKNIRENQDYQKIQEKGKQEIQSMFFKFVAHKYPQKMFDVSRVRINGNNSYHYDYQGVQIKYLGRMTWCLDDYDFFVDRYVSVDGAEILNLVKQ